MSEHSCGAGCSHGAKAAPAPAAAPAAKLAPSESGTGRVSVQNGKGSAPRSISKTFLNNYQGIRWASAGKKDKTRKEGAKFVKVY